LTAKDNESEERYKELNQTIIVKRKEGLVSEIKKRGVIVDRHLAIELRPADTLVVYMSTGGFEK